MLWLITEGQSCQITGCNVHNENNKYQVWVERTGGKTLKIAEGNEKDFIYDIKEAIDFAIENGEKVLKLT